MNAKTKNIITQAAPIVLCALFALMPLFEFIALCTGLDFRINAELALAVIFALLSAAALAFSLVYKPKYNKAGKILLTLALPLSILTALSFVTGSNNWSFLFALIWCGCALLLYIKFVPDSNLKALSAIVSVLLAIAFAVIWLWGLISTAFISDITVHSEHPSIDGYYKAEVCVSDSLIGSKTVVRISRAEKEFGVLLGRFWQYPTEIYEGEDYEYKTVQINWLDESTVIINGNEYVIE